MKNNQSDRTNLHNPLKTTKTIFYLDLRDEDLPQETEPIIQWLYHFAGHSTVTPSLSELVYQYYFPN